MKTPATVSGHTDRIPWQAFIKEAALRRIEIKIRLNVPESSAILNDISRLIERYLKRNKIEFHSIDARVKFDDDE